MAWLVNWHYLLLLSSHDAPLLNTTNLPLCCHLEIMRIHHLFITPGCQLGCFIAEIPNISLRLQLSQRSHKIWARAGNEGNSSLPSTSFGNIVLSVPLEDRRAILSSVSYSQKMCRAVKNRYQSIVLILLYVISRIIGYELIKSILFYKQQCSKKYYYLILRYLEPLKDNRLIFLLVDIINFIEMVFVFRTSKYSEIE